MTTLRTQTDSNRLSVVMFFERNENHTFDCIGRTAVIEEPWKALEIYANTPNPASQIVEAYSIQELLAQIEIMKLNMLDKAYLDKNVEPFL